MKGYSWEKGRCTAAPSIQNKQKNKHLNKKNNNSLFSSPLHLKFIQNSNLVYFSKADNLIKKNLIKLSLTKYSNYSLGCYINISEVE